MRKTLEELGYEKDIDIPAMVRYKKSRKEVDTYIRFYKDDKKIEANEVVYNQSYTVELSMEELKAIYKYCEDNKWI